MINTLELVRDFHKQMAVAPASTISNKLFRIALLREELAELEKAVLENDPVETLDALTDIQYVLDGTYLVYEMGEFKDVAFQEVHLSNLRKFFPDGSIKRTPQGKIIKPDGWRKPNLDNVVRRYIKTESDMELLRKLTKIWECGNKTPKNLFDNP